MRIMRKNLDSKTTTLLLMIQAARMRENIDATFMRVDTACNTFDALLDKTVKH